MIASWAYTLIRDAGSVLLDVSVDRKLERTIRARLEAGEDRITDLHVWQVGPVIARLSSRWSRARR